MVLANPHINGGDEYWFEALREEIAGVARKTEAEVGEAIVRWAYYRLAKLPSAG
jgi:hypothetical protein